MTKRVQHVVSRENKGTERESEGVGWDIVNSTKVIYRLAFERKSVSRNFRINTISLVSRRRFKRQNVTPFGPPLQAKF